MGHRFEALDSWRGIAAIMVVVFHFSPTFDWSWRGADFITHMDLAVDFFFLLSGFVISGAYQQRLQERRGVGDFFVRRVGRLFPLHLFTLAVMLVFAIFRGLSNGVIAGPRGIHDGALYDWDAIPSNLFLLQGIGFESHFTWNFPSWSISTEFYTYAVFAALWVVCGARSLWLTILLAIGIPALLLVWQAPGLGGSELFVCIYCFAIGALLRQAFNRAHARWAGSLGRFAATLAELATMTLAAGFMLNPVYATQLAPLAFAPMIFVFAFDAGWVSWLLRRGFPQMLGRVSYSIYLTHIPVLLIVGAWLGMAQRAGMFTVQYANTDGVRLYGADVWSGNVAMMLAVVVVVAVSLATYRWIELAGQAQVGRLAARWKARALRPRQNGAISRTVIEQTGDR